MKTLFRPVVHCPSGSSPLHTTMVPRLETSDSSFVIDTCELTYTQGEEAHSGEAIITHDWWVEEEAPVRYLVPPMQYRCLRACLSIT